MSTHAAVLTLHGKCLSPGMAEGITYLHRDALDRPGDFYDIETGQVAEEQGRLEKAIERITRDLGLLAGHVERELDTAIASVFEAHQLMLRDPTLRDDILREIADELVSADSAVSTVFRRWERRFRALDAEIAAHKGDDLRDLARRLINALKGVHGHALENLPAGSVLVASRLLPSDTVFLSRQSASAALLEHGGIGSHAALFAREVGLPCVAQLPGLLDRVPPGARALVDAGVAEVTINPDAAQEARFRSRIERRRKVELQVERIAMQPAITPEGRQIPVFANIACREDVEEALAKGAEGIGLYRIEQVYSGCQSPPDTGQLLAHLRQTLSPLGGQPVTIRLLDVGADKPLPFLRASSEPNPALGRRGVRLLRAYPDLLQTQLCALTQLAAEFDVRILVPMVVLASDALAVREALQRCCRSMGVSEPPPLGLMIETPAAALSAGSLAAYADFISVGTNDLTQYTLAADRENEAVDLYFDDEHEVIFRLIEMIRGDAPNLPLSVCGELAGRLESTQKLIRCGVETLSVSPPLIPHVKQAIRSGRA
jgi:phosphoenolpyruvate-protein phosphotransferase